MLTLTSQDELRRIRIGAVLSALLLAASPAVAQGVREPKVSVAPTHGIYINSQGNRWAWGENKHGQYGSGDPQIPQSSRTPVPVPGRKEIVDVAVGWGYSLFLLADGTVLAVGDNSRGQLGIGRIDILPGTRETPAPVTVPTPIAGLAGVKQLAAARTFAVALLEDGTVMAWGDRSDGKLGDGETGPFSDGQNKIPTPRPVRGLSGVKQIAVGPDFALALLGNGTVMGWGRAFRGELGEAVTGKTGVPLPIRGLERVKQIAASRDNGLALLEDGTVRTWGSRGTAIVVQPQLSDPTAGFSATPVPVPWLRNVRSLVASLEASHVMAILSDGTVRTWGWNGYYNQGLGHNQEYVMRPGQPKLTGVVAGAVAYSTTFFVLRDGSLLVSGPFLPSEKMYRLPTLIVKAPGR
jgi:alpha-tubulin suppressor-like RCC1 family protein